LTGHGDIDPGSRKTARGYSEAFLDLLTFAREIARKADRAGNFEV